MHFLFGIVLVITTHRGLAEIGLVNSQTFNNPLFWKYFNELSQPAANRNFEDYLLSKGTDSLTSPPINIKPTAGYVYSQDPVAWSPNQNNLLEKGEFQNVQGDVTRQRLGYKGAGQGEGQANLDTFNLPSPTRAKPAGSQFLDKLQLLESKIGGLHEIRKNPKAMNFLFDKSSLNGVRSSLSNILPPPTSSADTTVQPQTTKQTKTAIQQATQYKLPSQRNNQIQIPLYQTGQATPTFQRTVQPNTSSGQSSSSSILPVLMMTGGGDGVMDNPLILSELMKPNPNEGKILQALALTGSIEGVNPLLLTHLARNAQGQASNIIPLLVASGAENISPLLLNQLMQGSTQNSKTGTNNGPILSQKTATTPGQQKTGLNEMMTLMALSGGGENMSPLIMQQLMRGSGQGQGQSNIINLIALSGGELLENPLLMQYLSRSNRQSPPGTGTGNGGSMLNKLLPFLIAGNESLSENPMLMKRLLGQGRGNTFNSQNTL